MEFSTREIKSLKAWADVFRDELKNPDPVIGIDDPDHIELIADALIFAVSKLIEKKEQQ